MSIDVNLTRGDLHLKDGEELLLISLKGKQLALLLKPEDITLMDEEVNEFIQRFAVPAFQRLAEEILHP